MPEWEHARDMAQMTMVCPGTFCLSLNGLSVAARPLLPPAQLMMVPFGFDCNFECVSSEQPVLAVEAPMSLSHKHSAGFLVDVVDAAAVDTALHKLLVLDSRDAPTRG